MVNLGTKLLSMGSVPSEEDDDTENDEQADGNKSLTNRGDEDEADGDESLTKREDEDVPEEANFVNDDDLKDVKAHIA